MSSGDGKYLAALLFLREDRSPLLIHRISDKTADLPHSGAWAKDALDAHSQQRLTVLFRNNPSGHYDDVSHAQLLQTGDDLGK